jgi:hypothetical protein
MQKLINRRGIFMHFNVEGCHPHIEIPCCASQRFLETGCGMLYAVACGYAMLRWGDSLVDTWFCRVLTLSSMYLSSTI